VLGVAGPLRTREAATPKAPNDKPPPRSRVAQTAHLSVVWKLRLVTPRATSANGRRRRFDARVRGVLASTSKLPSLPKLEVNADFSRRALVHAAAAPWVPSPAPGVERRLLDRLGGEVARATSVVRYAPDSAFPAHTHGGGEEFLVLEGTFADAENGAFPPLSYVRNPPGSRHTPAIGADGCTILVKLWQMAPGDAAAVADRPAAGSPAAALRALPAGAPAARRPLFSDGHEDVFLASWPPGAPVRLPAPRGAEVFVLRGALACAPPGGEALAPWSWLRLPDGDELAGAAGDDGCDAWVKIGRSTAPREAPAPPPA